VGGTLPQQTFQSGYSGWTAKHDGSTSSVTHSDGGETYGATQKDENGYTWNRRTINKVHTQSLVESGTVEGYYIDGGLYVTATYSYNSGTVMTTITQGGQNSFNTPTANKLISYAVNTYPLQAGAADLSFSTLTTTIPSAKVVSVGTYTFLSQTTGSTTTNRFSIANYRNVTTGTYTADGSGVYETVTTRYGGVYNTSRWEVFDNSNDNSVFRVVAGEGGLPSYEELQAGAVIGEAGYSVEVGQVVVGTYNGSGSVNGTVETTAPTSQGTRSWTDFVTYETTYESTEEVWETFQTTREGWTDTTIATTTELFGTETDTTVDTETTYVETYEDYSSTTSIGEYEIYDTFTETSQVTVYQFTKTANQALIGTKPQIESYGETVTTYKTTTSSESFVQTIGNASLYTYIDWGYSTTGMVWAKPKEDGAIVGHYYVTTATGAMPRASFSTATVEVFTIPDQIVIASDRNYKGNFVRSFYTSSGQNNYGNYALIFGAASDNFLLEPVGPPCIGGVHRSGNKLELVDNCSHTFPAMLLWQGVHDPIHAAAFASSFYEGGVPLISHNIPWEHDSRTYNWLTADGSKGELKVQWTVDSTSTSSTTFSIGVEGQCSYTGGKRTSQAGGEYFSSRKATLVANCPAVVSIKGGTKSFAVGTHEITEPMRLDRRAGSVMASGILVIPPTYYAYNNVFITT
jgi:hypothetical protein